MPDRCRSPSPPLRRALGSLIPVGLRSLVDLPHAAALGTSFIRDEGAARRRCLAALPMSVRPRRALTLRTFLDRTRLELNWRSLDYYDRFSEPRWLRRIRWTIPESVDRAIASGRGVVLATAHYGALMHLGRWLCARGIARHRIGVLVDDQGWIDPRFRRGPDGRRTAARVFTPRLMRGMRRFLERGGVLIVAMDFPRGRVQSVRVGDRDLLLSTGALRLAAWNGAAVVPCIARERWWWRGAVEMGEPLAPELVMDPSRHPQACEAIAGFFMRAIAKDPVQSSAILLARFVEPGHSPSNTKAV